MRDEMPATPLNVESKCPLLPRAEATAAAGRNSIDVSTIAFLVPLFALFIFGPLLVYPRRSSPSTSDMWRYAYANSSLCIWLVNNRRFRDPNPDAGPRFRCTSPSEKRAKVRSKLEGVTTIVRSMAGGAGFGFGDVNEKGTNAVLNERKDSVGGEESREKDW